ncbi:MAG: DegV family protein [Ruthenibacterium lactatiformans]
MNDFVLSCCSTADLTAEHFAARDIHYICFHYSLNGKQYADDLGKSMPFDQFYQAMADGAETQTSQVNVEEFTAYFTPFLEQGKDILHVTLSSGISGVYNSACVAREELLQKYPDRKIYIVDSLGASSGYGLLMDRLADLRDKGEDVDSVYEWALANRLRLHHWFFSTDLTFYVKGGRISKASGWFGTVLNICPLLNMDDQGRLIPRSKIRGKKAVIKEIVSRMEQFADGGTNYNGKCYISNSACMRTPAQWPTWWNRSLKLNGKVEINHVGTTIGSTGPGTVALFFGAPSARNKTGGCRPNRKESPHCVSFEAGAGSVL